MTSSDILDYTSDYISPQNGIIIVGSTIKLAAGYTLQALQLTYSTIGPIFSINYFQSSSLVYDVRLYSKSGLKSIRGSFEMTATLSYSGIITNITTPFAINYQIMIPSTGNLTYSTDIFLSDSPLGAPKGLYKFGERVYVTTALSDFS